MAASITHQTIKEFTLDALDDFSGKRHAFFSEIYRRVLKQVRDVKASQVQSALNDICRNEYSGWKKIKIANGNRTAYSDIDTKGEPPVNTTISRNKQFNAPARAPKTPAEIADQINGDEAKPKFERARPRKPQTIEPTPEALRNAIKAICIARASSDGEIQTALHHQRGITAKIAEIRRHVIALTESGELEKFGGNALSPKFGAPKTSAAPVLIQRMEDSPLVKAVEAATTKMERMETPDLFSALLLNELNKTHIEQMYWQMWRLAVRARVRGKRLNDERAAHEKTKMNFTGYTEDTSAELDAVRTALKRVGYTGTDIMSEIAAWANRTKRDDCMREQLTTLESELITLKPQQTAKESSETESPGMKIVKLNRANDDLVREKKAMQATIDTLRAEIDSLSRESVEAKHHDGELSPLSAPESAQPAQSGANNVQTEQD